ncbi:MAG: glycosyltransferase [Candidatus Aceula lacicola]|nr:glycosyltransferase [Candidatus Aceula lacicola]
MENSKILLMHITKTSGHHRATVAIENALKIVSPSVETMNINGFAYAYPILEKIVNRAYMSVIKRRPKIWDYLYDNPAVIKRTGTIKKILNNAKHSKLARLFERFQPDCVICSQAFPCGMVGDLKKRYKYPVRLIGVLTDFAPHHYWLHDEVDYYIVPTEEAQDRLIADGISSERIKLFGIPIDPKFNEPVSAKEVADKMGFNLSVPTILVMGGGQGLGPIRSIVSSLAELELNFQLIVLSGTNKKVLKMLKRIRFPNKQKIKIFPYIDNVNELMDISTLIVTKPGGMTTAESLAKGMPMVVVDPIPGQEARNTKLLLEKGIAVEVDDVDEVGIKIRELLDNPEKIKSMSKAALKHSNVHSALNIAKLVLK